MPVVRAERGGAGAAPGRHLRQKNAANYAQRAEQAVAASSRLERLVVDMESGVRGYLLTGTNRFLEPYRKALVLYPTASGALIQTATTARTQGMATDIQATSTPT